MVQLRNDDLITALDIGTSKICALIGRVGAEGALEVLGTGQRESRGVKHGYVADMAVTENAVREAVEQAERMAGVAIDQVWVGFSAGGLVSEVASVEVEIGGYRIEQGDIDNLLSAGRNTIAPDGRMVLHAQPALYTIDGLEGVKSPLGLHADRLGVDIHVIAVEPSPVRNLDLCVRSAHLDVKAIVAAPVATGMACLSDEERDLGVALVELGAGVTNISLFAGGLLVGLASIPMGGGDITDDISAAFGVRRSLAERVKCFHGSANSSPRDNHEMIDLVPSVADAEASEAQRITRAALNGVIRQRLDHWFGDIARSLEALGFTGPFGRQVVLTGGGAELKGIADYAQGLLGRSVRVGRPRGLAGLPEAHGGPAFATLAGLALFAASNPLDLRPLAPQMRGIGAPKGGMIERFIAALKGSY